MQTSYVGNLFGGAVDPPCHTTDYHCRYLWYIVIILIRNLNRNKFTYPLFSTYFELKS